jgi:uncharacterized protein
VDERSWFVKIISTLGVALLAVTLSSPAQAQQPPPDLPVVVTNGSGVIKRAPDRAYVNISAESRAKTPAEAQKLNTDAMGAVLQKIKGMGLPAEAIRTSGYDLNPEFDYANNKQTLRGYVARNSIEVRVDDFPKLGEVLDAAVTAGATSVSGVRFDLKDRTGAEQAALKAAIADARTQADTAAQAAGVKVERIARIEVNREGITPPPGPRPMFRAEMASVAAGAPPIAPGELEVRVSVTMTAVIR